MDNICSYYTLKYWVEGGREAPFILLTIFCTSSSFSSSFSSSSSSFAPILFVCVCLSVCLSVCLLIAAPTSTTQPHIRRIYHHWEREVNDVISSYIYRLGKRTDAYHDTPHTHTRGRRSVRRLSELPPSPPLDCHHTHTHSPSLGPISITSAITAIIVHVVATWYIIAATEC